MFDRRYLLRAVALYRSLERCCAEFVLHGVCMDAESLALIERLSLPFMRAISIEAVEAADPGLRAVRPTRALWEYCWTSKPVILRYVLDLEPEAELLTYLDADLCFYSAPTSLLEELGDGSVLLIPQRHLYPENEPPTGVFNAGLVTFRRDQRALQVLDWWRERCLEWCYDRQEPGLFADQKYLDDWPERFEGVVVSRQWGAGLAWWNEPPHHVEFRGPVAAPLVDGRPLIYFHHTGLRLHPATALNRRMLSQAGSFRLVRGPVDLVFGLAGDPGSADVEAIWQRYVGELSSTLRELQAAGASRERLVGHTGRRAVVQHLARRMGLRMR